MLEKVSQKSFKKLDGKVSEFLHEIKNHPFPIGYTLFYNIKEKIFEIDLYGPKSRYENQEKEIKNFCEENHCVFNYKKWSSKKAG